LVIPEITSVLVGFKPSFTVIEPSEIVTPVPRFTPRLSRVASTFAAVPEIVIVFELLES
jgi:hypothetical protein